MNYFFSYIVQFLPIFMGIGTMLLLRSINIKKNGVRIETTCEASLVPEEEIKGTAFSVVNDSLQCLFEKEIREELIVAGLYDRKARSSDFSKLAFSRLGMIRIHDLNKLHGCGTAHCSTLTVFVRDYGEFQDEICTFRNRAGILLAHLADCSLELISR